MSFDHLALVPDLDLPPQQQLVLWHMATLACQRCGLAWPGMKFLEKRTRLGEKSIASAVRELKYAGHIAVFGYSKGGRGKSTEYVILPTALELETAPCAVCAENLKTPQGKGGFRSGAREKPLKGEGLSDKPRLNPPCGVTETPQGKGTTQSLTHTQSPRARAREADPPPSASGSASPRLSDTPPQSAEDARRADDIFAAFVAHAASESGHSAKPDASTALIEAEAREPGQETEHPPEADAPEG